MIREVHSGLLPDDTVYELVERCADALAEVDADDDPDGDYIFSDAINEIEPDIYNRDLVKWLSDNLSNAEYVDQAIKEFGNEIAEKGIWSLLQMGQSLHIQEIGASLLSELEDVADAIEE